MSHQEDVYDRAMQIGLRLTNIGYEDQKVVELKHKDHYVWKLIVELAYDKESGYGGKRLCAVRSKWGYKFLAHPP